jgi:hypothetical protein
VKLDDVRPRSSARRDRGDGVGLNVRTVERGTGGGQRRRRSRRHRVTQSGAKIIEALRPRVRRAGAAHRLHARTRDHVGGASTFAGKRSRGRPRPTVWAHENVLARPCATSAPALEQRINRRQLRLPAGMNTFPRGLVPPDRTSRTRDDFESSPARRILYPRDRRDRRRHLGLAPDRRVAFIGDLLIGSSNAVIRTRRSATRWAGRRRWTRSRRAPPHWCCPVTTILEGDQARGHDRDRARASSCTTRSSRLNEANGRTRRRGWHPVRGLAKQAYLVETSGCAQSWCATLAAPTRAGGGSAELFRAARTGARRRSPGGPREAILDRGCSSAAKPERALPCVVAACDAADLSLQTEAEPAGRSSAESALRGARLYLRVRAARGASRP